MVDEDEPTVDRTVRVRQARRGDAEGVAAFTENTWEEFDQGDYVPDVFPEWVESDGPDQHTVVAEAGGGVVGCSQVVRLSEHEAWTQGMRVHPEYRERGVAGAMDDACRSWARERGAAVARNMVFSWNLGGLAAARSVGYRPRTEFRWAHPEPDRDGTVEAATGDSDEFEIDADPDAAWTYWQRSDARDALGGLTLDPGESWALSECRPERFRRAADETATFAVTDDDGTRAASFRVRDYEREGGDSNEDDAGESERWVEYGVGAWDSVDSARALFEAVRRDAAALDADRTRVLIPETPRHVSDAAAVGVPVGDDPDFVFEADLTGRT